MASRRRTILRSILRARLGLREMRAVYEEARERRRWTRDRSANRVLRSVLRRPLLRVPLAGYFLGRTHV